MHGQSLVNASNFTAAWPERDPVEEDATPPNGRWPR
jgi:hypothetical protein